MKPSSLKGYLALTILGLYPPCDIAQNNEPALFAKTLHAADRVESNARLLHVTP